jgi:hypothetical protein
MHCASMPLQKRHELSQWNPSAVASRSWFRDCKNRVKMKGRREVRVRVRMGMRGMMRWW